MAADRVDKSRLEKIPIFFKTLSSVTQSTLGKNLFY